MIDELSQKRCQKLTDKGIDHLEAGRYDEAIKVALELEDAKAPLAFYLAGESYARRNDYKSAVASMRRGVLKAPVFWTNWFFLGINLRHLHKDEEALAAFHQALLCPLVDADTVRLNMAILAIECQDFESALTHLDRIEKNNLRWGVEGSRVLALEGVGRFAEAAELGEQILEERPEGDEDYDKRVGFVAAAVARIRLRQGSSTDEVRSFLLHCLDEYGCSRPVLSGITGLEGLRYSNDSKYFRFVIHARLPVGHPWYPKAQEYGIVYDVISDSESGALEMINQFESAAGVESLAVLRVEIKEDKPDEPMGVYWFTERVFP
jgi:tetratricopeptide (TPR) repeat protein